MPRHPQVSPTSRSLSDRIYTELTAYARGRGGTLHPLHVGDTYREPLAAAQAEAQRTADRPRLHNYAPVQGEPTLLDAIEERLLARSGRAVDRERIQVVPGATAGISIICQVLLDPGDEVIIPAPFWPLVRGIVASRGAQPVQVPWFDRLDDPTFDPEAELERVVTDRTCALYLNTPHNPTGSVLGRDVIDAMARVASRHDLWVLCDETYEELWFTDEAPPASWTHPELEERAIAIHSVSKSYGLAGARVGYVHGPATVMPAIRGVQTFQTYCAPRPMQFAAAAALRGGDEWLRASRELYRTAGARAAAVLGLPVPQAGTFLFFDLRPRLLPGEAALDFLKRCLDAGVLLTPGGACGDRYADWARLCFTSVTPAELELALAALAPLFHGTRS